MLKLDERVEEKRRGIHTDSYSMSIGEMVNLYTDGELDIHPEFQRIYRWNQEQKSRLIESILLGIPLPSFFVAQRDDGIWDVVDGLQRLSTIFSFLGIYKNEKDQIDPPLMLTATEHFPELEGMYWNDESNPHLSKDLQRAFKREKIDLNIIKKKNDEHTKYELFQRLNTLDSSLSDQEVRNCLLIMVNKRLYSWLSDMADYESFTKTLPLTSKQYDEQYHVELALRYLALKDINIERIHGLSDIGEFLTKRMKELTSDKSYDFESEGEKFKKAFRIMNAALGESVFKKFKDDRYLGPFSLSVYEVIALGVGFNIDDYDENEPDHLNKIKDVSECLLDNAIFVENSGSGVRDSSRILHFLPMGRELLSL